MNTSFWNGKAAKQAYNLTMNKKVFTYEFAGDYTTFCSMSRLLGNRCWLVKWNVLAWAKNEAEQTWNHGKQKLNRITSRKEGGVRSATHKNDSVLKFILKKCMTHWISK